MILAVTGHRPEKLGGYRKEVYARLRGLAKQELSELLPEAVITGMALGWDMAVADACLDLEIPFIAAVPFKGQESVWPAASKFHYQELLELADRTEVVCDGGYAAWKMQCRNEWMVDHADRLLALWDGTAGGTGNCVKYATGKIPITNCWMRYENLGQSDDTTPGGSGGPQGP